MTTLAPATPRRLCVEDHIPLVLSIVRRIVNRLPRLPAWTSLEDLEQEGMLALMKALKGFRPEFGWRFSTYATPAIVRQVYRVLRLGKCPSREVDDVDVRGAIESLPGRELPLFEGALRADEARRLRKALGDLEPRISYCLRARYLQDRTLEYIGARVGLSRERVRQLCLQGAELLAVKLRERA